MHWSKRWGRISREGKELILQICANFMFGVENFLGKVMTKIHDSEVLISRGKRLDLYIFFLLYHCTQQKLWFYGCEIWHLNIVWKDHSMNSASNRSMNFFKCGYGCIIPLEHFRGKWKWLLRKNDFSTFSVHIFCNFYF